MSAIVAVLRRAAHALLAHSSSGQLALGFTVGMIIGLVPKGNLIALSLCVLLFSLRCNKGIALVAVLLFSLVSPSLDPIAHKLGFAALTLPSLQATYASIHAMPFGPWLGFNNTIVAGSLLLGLYGAYPTFYVFKQVCSAFARPLARRFCAGEASLREGGEA